MKYFLFNIPTIILVLVAGYLAVNHIDGWGWFLFGALVFGVVSPKEVQNKNESED